MGGNREFSALPHCYSLARQAHKYADLIFFGSMGSQWE
jgi:hypothetical protein